MTFFRKWNSRAALIGTMTMLSLLLMGFGIVRGEVQTVLNKAIYICLECIGIG